MSDSYSMITAWITYITTCVQLGATYIVDVGGDVILEHRQNSIGDFLDNADILRSLGIDAGLAPPSGAAIGACCQMGDGLC